MKIIHDEQPKKTRPYTFADVPAGGVFKSASGLIYVRGKEGLKCALVSNGDHCSFLDANTRVDYYPEAVLRLGSPVTEVVCD